MPAHEAVDLKGAGGRFILGIDQLPSMTIFPSLGAPAPGFVFVWGMIHAASVVTSDVERRVRSFSQARTVGK
jgi:hypothetical protein